MELLVELTDQDLLAAGVYMSGNEIGIDTAANVRKAVGK